MRRLHVVSIGTSFLLFLALALALAAVESGVRPGHVWSSPVLPWLYGAAALASLGLAFLVRRLAHHDPEGAAGGPDRKALAQTPRLNEERLQALVSESQDMIMTIDSAGRIIDINRAGARLLGYEDADQVIGRVESDLWSNPRDHGVFLTLIKESDSVKNFEVILKRADGATVFGLESATLIRDARGEVAHIYAIVKDITARIHDEQVRWKMNMDLAEANQKLKASQTLIVQQEKLASIGQLAAGIAHEINNPLGFMKSNQSALAHYLRNIESFLTSLHEGTYPSLAHAEAAYDIGYILTGLGKILDDLDEGLRRISEIVQNLRAFSRIDSADTYAPCDINAGIQKSLVVANNEVKYSATVDLKLGPLPLVECVEGEILQVLLNIIVNAAQAIKGQGRAEKGSIHISTGVADASVWIEIADDGPGIPRDIQSKIFDAFFTTKPAGQGTGLGLSISYDIIVNKHGGSLSLVSEPGSGSCFRIEIPISHPAAQERSLIPTKRES